MKTMLHSMRCMSGEVTTINMMTLIIDDSSGQLGLCGFFQDKGIQAHLSPKICSFNVVIKSISCGFKHSLFVSESGHVYGMGSNSHGQLGIADPQSHFKNTPTLVEGAL